jgi:hypothetical protein
MAEGIHSLKRAVRTNTKGKTCTISSINSLKVSKAFERCPGDRIPVISQARAVMLGKMNFFIV